MSEMNRREFGKSGLAGLAALAVPNAHASVAAQAPGSGGYRYIHLDVFTDILVPATRQMALRIQLEEAGRSRADVPELKLVYKLTSATPKAPSGPSH